MVDFNNLNPFLYFQGDYSKTVNIPIELYQSTKGRYFIGYADNLKLGAGTSAWARLYNPPNSGVLLHVNVWTVTDISTSPFRAQFWFNATTPGQQFVVSPLVTPSNTAIQPAPQPRVQIHLASNVTEEPSGGVKAFVRRGEAGTTVVDTENGKLIFPPNGSFLVYLSIDDPDVIAGGRVAFGWWEEKIVDKCVLG